MQKSFRNIDSGNKGVVNFEQLRGVFGSFVLFCLLTCLCLFVCFCFLFFYRCNSRILWFQAVTVYVEFMETNTPFVYFCLSYFMEARYWAQPKRIVVFVEKTQQRGKRRVRFVNQLRLSKTWNKRNENLLEVVAGSINATIGHFWVSRGLCFKARLSAKPLIWKRLFPCANVNETRYLKNVFAFSLVLKVRVFGTRKAFICFGYVVLFSHPA